MGKKAKSLSLILSVLTILSFFTTAVLAAPVSMSMQDGNLLVLPEYDQNNVIVNFGGIFVNDTGTVFEDDIWYYVPKDAEIFMVCETEKGMTCVKYDAYTTEGDYKIIKWKPSRAIKPGERYPVMFEYTFVPALQEGTRNFDVIFKSDAKIEGLEVEIKQPLRSNDFQIEPMFQQKGQDSKGLTRYQRDYPSLEAGEELHFSVSYNKSDNKPSIEKPAADTIVDATDHRQQNNSMLIVLSIGLLIVLVAVIVLTFNQNKTASSLGNKDLKAGATKQPRKAETKARGNVGRAQAARKAQSDEKRKIRKLLLDGKISEQTYKQLLEEVEG